MRPSARTACTLASFAPVLAAGFLAISAAAQGAPSVHATRVVAFDDKNQAGGGIFDPSRALGAPAGPTDVHSLGLGGFLTLGFDVVIVDGPGADLLFAENPFTSTTDPSQTFAEVFFVEVSTDGVSFARVPTSYTGPQVDPGPFSFTNMGYYMGFGGLIAPVANPVEPTDIVGSGGDAIDLAVLRNDPLVVNGSVDLNDIREVRLVDARSGIDTDSNGVFIRDPGSGSADVDAVTVLQHRDNQSASGPVVELVIPADGRFELTITDPDGLGDLASLRVALWGVELPFVELLPGLAITSLTPTSIALQLPVPLPPSLLLVMSATVTDTTGVRSSASATRG